MKSIKIYQVLSIGLALLLLGQSPIGYAESEVKPSILHPKGLLWKIEKQGKSTSYLYGTMHVSHPQVIKLSAPAEQAFMQADHFVMEVLMNIEAMGIVSRASFFNDGRTLQKVMKKERYKQLMSLLNKRIFIAEEVISNMKPWAVLMVLMMPVSEQLEGAAALDLVLYQRAIQRKLQVSGLETAQEQIAVFEAMSLADQLWMLNKAMDEIDEMDALFPEMLNAYVNRDLAQLISIQNEFNDEASNVDDKFMYLLLDKRNVRMAKRLLPILKQGRAFIAIGALHLPTKGGVLSLLEMQGYKVTSVY